MENPKEKVISCSNCISISDKKLHMNLQKYGGNRLASESNLSLTWSLIKCNGVVSKQIQSIFFSTCIYKKTNYYTINKK